MPLLSGGGAVTYGTLRYSDECLVFLPVHISVIPTCGKSAIPLVSVVTLPSLIGQIMLMVISRALSTSSSESLSLSLELSAYSLFGDSGKLASSFELKSMRRG